MGHSNAYFYVIGSYYDVRKWFYDVIYHVIETYDDVRK